MPSTKTKPSNSPAANSPNSPPAQHPNRVTRARIRPGHAHCRSLGVPGISPRQQNDARASRAPFRAAAFLAPGSAGPAVCPPPCAVARWVPGFGPSCLWVSDDLERTTGLEPSTLTLGNAEFCWSPLLGDEAADGEPKDVDLVELHCREKEDQWHRTVAELTIRILDAIRRADPFVRSLKVCPCHRRPRCHSLRFSMIGGPQEAVDGHYRLCHGLRNAVDAGGPPSTRPARGRHRGRTRQSQT